METGKEAKEEAATRRYREIYTYVYIYYTHTHNCQYTHCTRVADIPEWLELNVNFCFIVEYEVSKLI